MDHSGHGMMTDLPPFTLSRGLEPSFNGFFLFACLLGLALYGWGWRAWWHAATAGRPGGPSRSSSACSPCCW